MLLRYQEATKDADLVIISAPLSSYKEILLSIKSSLKEGSILTDTGSVKKEVNKIVNNLGLKNISWIASHPIAGTEYSGPAAGFQVYLKIDGVFFQLKIKLLKIK